MESRLRGQEEVRCINSLRALRRCRDSLVSPLQMSSGLFLLAAPCARHANAHVRTCVSGCQEFFWECVMRPHLKQLFSKTQRFGLPGAKSPCHPQRGRVTHFLKSKRSFISKSAALLEHADKRKACFLGAESRLRELEGV